MALGPASPQTAPLGSPPPPPGNMYNNNTYESDVMQLRQQMFPAILTTYGIPPDSERARSLALMLGMQDMHTPAYSMPARIGYHTQWGHSQPPPSMPLLNNCPSAFDNIPGDVLTHIFAFEAVPRALMWQWYNVSKQWRRCLSTPLAEFYDFVRLCRLSLHRQKNVVERDYASLVPRPYAVSIAVLKCMRCERNSLVEQSSAGTMWGHCTRCSTDGQFDILKSNLHVLDTFPAFIKMRNQQAQEDG